eukprot:6626475-Pyramimonas_sp.AAC.1
MCEGPPRRLGRKRRAALLPPSSSARPPRPPPRAPLARPSRAPGEGRGRAFALSEQVQRGAYVFAHVRSAGARADEVGRAAGSA